MIVHFVAVIARRGISYQCSNSRWIERTESLLTLCRVSRLCWACAIPYLYREIRLRCREDLSNLRSLWCTLNNSEGQALISRHVPDGYSSHTKTFVLLVPLTVLRLDGLSAEIGTLIPLMTGLQTALVCSMFPHQPGYGMQPNVKAHTLSTLQVEGTRISFLLNHSSILQGLSCLQRLSIRRGISGQYGELDLLSISSGVLLPNIQEISIQQVQDDAFFSGLLAMLTTCVIPRFKSLHVVLSQPTEQFLTPVIYFLRSQGALLRHLTLKVGILEIRAMPDIFQLCRNLFSVTISCGDIGLLSFPAHINLETVDVRVIACRIWEGFNDPYMESFDLFTLSWRSSFPNLRVANFQWYAPSDQGPLIRPFVDMIANFCTEDEFFTVRKVDEIYKRWGGRRLESCM